MEKYQVNLAKRGVVSFAGDDGENYQANVVRRGVVIVSADNMEQAEALVKVSESDITWSDEIICEEICQITAL